MIEITDHKGRLLTFHETVAGMTASQLALATNAPLTSIFSRPVRYRGKWTAHYLVDSGYGGSYPMLIPLHIARVLREQYKVLDGATA